MAAPDVVVLDYGSGNLRSAQRALERVGATVTVTSDADAAMEADGLVVPGVGAFAACMAGIEAVRGGMIIDRRLAGGTVSGGARHLQRAAGHRVVDDEERLARRRHLGGPCGRGQRAGLSGHACMP